MKRFLLCMAIGVVSLIVGTTAKAYDFSAVNDDGVTIYYTLVGAATDRQVEVSQAPMVTITDEYGMVLQVNSYLELHYNIPETVTYGSATYKVVKIGDNAFDSCPLQSIDLPESVTTIGSEAFSSCPLQSIVLPESLTTIGYNAFSSTNLQSINFPSKLKNIGSSAFSYCRYLTSVRLPNNCTFGDDTFYQCASLHDIIWPESALSIPSFMFANCGFTEIEIPKNIYEIGDCAFANNPLKKITIQDNNKFWEPQYIYSSFLNNCTKLEEIKCCCLIPPTASYYGTPFEGISALNCKLIVPEESLDRYQRSEGWNKFVNVETYSIPATDIRLKNENIVGLGSQEDFPISVIPENATNRLSYTISVQDPSICDLDDMWYVCYINGKSQGETTVTVTLGELQATAKVKVVDPNTMLSIGFNKSVVQIESNEEKYISLNILPGSARDYYSFSWSSSDENVFTILSSSNYGGSIKGLTPGTATLTVTASNGMTASCTIVVGGVALPDEKYGEGPNQLTCKHEPYTSQDPANQVGKAADNSWRANNIHITDLNEVVNPYSILADNLTYTRTFSSTNWQGLYVPFAMNYNEWRGHAIVAELAGIHMYDDNGDGTPDRTNVEFATVNEGSLLPNVPYLIKPLQTGTVDFTCANRTLCPTQNVHGSVNSSTARWKYTLIGTYVTLTDKVGDGFYSLGDGKFRHNDSDVPPLRFILQMTKQSGGYWGAPGKNLYPDELEISIDGETVSGIDNVTVDYDINAADGGYYDLMGRKVENPSNGIFLHNNKLILIK